MTQENNTQKEQQQQHLNQKCMKGCLNNITQLTSILFITKGHKEHYMCVSTCLLYQAPTCVLSFNTIFQKTISYYSVWFQEVPCTLHNTILFARHHQRITSLVRQQINNWKLVFADINHTVCKKHTIYEWHVR